MAVKLMDGAGIFFLVLALGGAPAAVAGEETATGRVTAALEQAPPADAPRLVSAQAETAPPPAAKGNPLWAIPMQTLDATRERPLFSASRRPPPPVVAAAPAPAPPAEPVVAAPSAPERPPLALIGTIVSADTRVAVILNSATSEVTRLREGEADSGWVLRSVTPRSIIVEKGDQSVTLSLPSRDEPSSAPAVAEGAPMPEPTPMPISPLQRKRKR